MNDDDAAGEADNDDEEDDLGYESNDADPPTTTPYVNMLVTIFPRADADIGSMHTREQSVRIFAFSEWRPR